MTVDPVDELLTVAEPEKLEISPEVEEIVPAPETEEKEIQSEGVEESGEVKEDTPQDEKQDNGEDFNIEFEDDDDETQTQTQTPPPIKEIQEPKKEKLPIYETTNNQGISEADMPFKVGDKVYHPKHGYGTIEGFANYSNKILFCQIDFDNVGRRILDPRISGIEKVS